MTAQKAFENPGSTDAIDGEVVQQGPDGVGLSMTPDAAEETGRRLIATAAIARKQSPDESGAEE